MAGGTGGFGPTGTDRLTRICPDSQAAVTLIVISNGICIASVVMLTACIICESSSGSSVGTYCQFIGWPPSVKKDEPPGTESVWKSCAFTPSCDATKVSRHGWISDETNECGPVQIFRVMSYHHS